MELLLTVLLFLWQLGWVVLLGGVLWAAALWLIRPLRKWKKLTFIACAAAICLLLAVLCVRPIVLGGSAEEREEARQLAAGRYSQRLPVVTPVCAVVDDGTVQVWYAFAGNVIYRVDGEGYSIVKPLFPWT